MEPSNVQTGQNANEAESDGKAPLRVTLVNDYEIIVQGLQRMLEPFSDRIEIVETEVGGLPSLPTDIALFDTFGGRRYSLSRVQAMARDLEIGKVVLYTWDAPPAFRDDVAQQCVDAVILKSETGEALVEALERVHAGEIGGFDDLESSVPSTTLTQREQEVLALMALGKSNREIAHELYLSVDTVKTHVRTLFQKLGVSNRTQAALTAAEYGVAPPRMRDAS
jgi:DNA-binding NarL/FixJ family response regulator